MKPVDAAVLGIVWFGSHLVVSVDDVRPVGIDLDLSHIVRKVDERFLSVALDASLIAEEKFMNLLSLPRLRTLSRALTPAFLRFGGTQQDFMKFSPAGRNISSAYRRHFENSCESLNFPPLLEKKLKEEWILQSNLLLQEELVGQYRKTKFSEYAVDLLYTFANCSGFHLIFGLNALFRTSENAWNSRNAELLLKYCESKPYAMSWELGNEPNSYVKKAGVRMEGNQLGRDFVHLRQILLESTVYRSSDLYGPDISQPRDHRKDLLTGFLETGSKAISACTWHHYYVNGRDASLEDFLDPVVLNSLAAKINEVLKIVRSVSPGKKVWLGETSSAYDGGAAGLSDTFVAGFMWLDKLGLSAKLGLDVVIRQVLIGSGSYHLVDENLDPLPDYWLSLLYKRLVGPEVLRVLKTSRAEPAVRLYLHCTHRKSEHYRPGAVTLFALNLEENQASVRLPKRFTNRTIEAFVLQAAEDGKQGLYSRTVRLNGKVLKMLDDQTLPVLQGCEMAAGHHITLPGFSLAFYVLTEAGSPVC